MGWEHDDEMMEAGSKNFAWNADVSRKVTMSRLPLRSWRSIPTRRLAGVQPEYTARRIWTMPEGSDRLETPDDWTTFQLRRADRKQISTSSLKFTDKVLT